jgi:hypothetical protein
MTASELIELFLFPASLRSPLGDQFSNWVAAFCCPLKPTPKAFERRQPGLHQQPVVLDASDEVVALTEAELFA